MPLQLSLALHLSSLAPDFAYKVAENSLKNTHVNIGLVKTTGNDVEMHLKLNLDLDGDGVKDGAKEYKLERTWGMHQHIGPDGAETGYESKEEALENSDDGITDDEKKEAYSNIDQALDDIEERIKKEKENNGGPLIAGDLFFSSVSDEYNSEYSNNADNLAKAESQNDVGKYWYRINNQYIMELQQILLDYLDEDGNPYADKKEDGRIEIKNENSSVDNRIHDIIFQNFKLNSIQSSLIEDKFLLENGNEVPEIQIDTTDREDEGRIVNGTFEELFSERSADGTKIIGEGAKIYSTEDLTPKNKYTAHKYNVIINGEVLADAGWTSKERTENANETPESTIPTIYYNTNLEEWYQLTFWGEDISINESYFEYLIDWIEHHFPLRVYYRLINVETGEPVTSLVKDDYNEYDYNDNLGEDATGYYKNDDGWFWKESIPVDLRDAIKEKNSNIETQEIFGLLNEAEEINTYNFTRYVPITLSVTGHWYQNLDYKGAYEWSNDESYKINKYIYTAKSDDSDVLKKASDANIIYIEERTQGAIEQVGDPQITKTNFLNSLLEDEYYKYNGVNKSEEKEKIDFKDTAVDAIAMLEQIQGQNAQMIIRMFKEFMATQGIKFEETTQTALKKQLFSKVIKGYNGELLTDGEFDSVYRAEIPPTQTGFSEGLTVQSPVKGKVTFRTDDSVCILIDAPGKDFDQYTILISGFKVDSNIKADETELSEGTKIGETIRQDVKLVLRDENCAVVKNEYITTDENGNIVNGED